MKRVTNKSTVPAEAIHGQSAPMPKKQRPAPQVAPSNHSNFTFNVQHKVPKKILAPQSSAHRHTNFETRHKSPAPQVPPRGAGE
jgi:hypothetical protein